MFYINLRVRNKGKVYKAWKSLRVQREFFDTYKYIKLYQVKLKIYKKLKYFIFEIFARPISVEGCR